MVEFNGPPSCKKISNPRADNIMVVFLLQPPNQSKYKVDKYRTIVVKVVPPRKPSQSWSQICHPRIIKEKGVKIMLVEYY